jgi:hypothetical protein
MKIPIVLLILLVFALLRWRKAGTLTWALAWWIGFFVAIRWGFSVPIPSSVIFIYMGIATLAVLAYVTSSADRRREVTEPIVRLIVEPSKRLALLGVVLLLPTLAAAAVYFRMSQPIEAPFFARTVHPASPPRSPSTTRRSSSIAATTRTGSSRRPTPRRTSSTSPPAARSTTATATSATATTSQAPGCSCTGSIRSRRTSPTSAPSRT